MQLWPPLATLLKHPGLGQAEHDQFIRRLSEIAPALDVVADALFAGYFDRSNLTWWLRFIDRFVSTPQGDHRNWPEIRSWAKSLVPQFASSLENSP